ncbi:prepilin-type N-terminal cleavage/methylation domain-containing protein [Candidatus Parcubacteria bacterium]|nr:prepilin-type N-terminal cleavage/methylation domain-containing protein [Candidatus Parcubacteria bacterium]
MKNLKGFTLIELLVVISIIGVIASIVLVSFSGSRDKAKLAKGQHFDAQVHHALGAYAVGIWRFEEAAGIDIHDESGYGNHGTFYGNPTPVFPDGVYSGTKALQFDGSNDYVKLDSDNFDGNYTAFSILFWINTNTDTPTTYGMAMHRNDGTSIGSSTFFGGVVTGTNELVATIGAGSGPGWVAGRTGVIASSGTWYHVVCSWDGTTARTYVNGVKKKQYSLLATNFINKPATTRFGASGDASGYLFNGQIDNVRIYEQSLSVSQIQQHYAEGVAAHGIVLR